MSRRKKEPELSAADLAMAEKIHAIDNATRPHGLSSNALGTCPRCGRKIEPDPVDPRRFVWAIHLCTGG